MGKRGKKEEERKQNHGNVEETRDQKEYLRDAYLNGTRGKGGRESTPTANTNFRRLKDETRGTDSSVTHKEAHRIFSYYLIFIHHSIENKYRTIIDNGIIFTFYTILLFYFFFFYNVSMPLDYMLRNENYTNR